MKKDLAGLALIILITLALMIITIEGIGVWKCDNLTALNPSHKFEYIFPNGCLIRTRSGLWLPVENVKYLIDREPPDSVRRGE